jgi:hypothetical protein
MCRGCFGPGDDPHPGDGIATIRWWLGCDSLAARRWLAGWLGIQPGWSPQAVPRPIERRVAIPDDPGGRWAIEAEQYRQAMPEAWRRRAAELLGLPVEPLVRLGVGWSPENRATAWPMRDGGGRVVGVRLRDPATGRKWAVTGSRAGLIFDPSLLDRSVSRLWIVEGPSDAAAMLSIGVDAVGVPSAGCGGDLLAEICRRAGVEDAVIVADADGPGRSGAERLADALMPLVPSVRLIDCPSGAKDPRAAVAAGVDVAVFEQTAAAAPVRSLGIGRAGR